MKYIKGNQKYSLSDKSIPLLKCRVTCGNGSAEGIWVKQADNEVVLQNDSIHFLPFRTWGMVLPSKCTSKDTEGERETIDVTKLRGSSPEGVVLTLHPDAWNDYVKNKYIDENGDLLEKDEEESSTDKSLLN